MFNKGKSKVDTILDVRTIIQTHHMVKSLARMLLDSRKDRNMLYLQRKPIFLESHSEVEDNTLELSLNNMTKMLEHHENNKEKITEEEFRWM